MYSVCTYCTYQINFGRTVYNYIYTYVQIVQNIYVLRSSRHLLYVKYGKIFWRTLSYAFQFWFILFGVAQAKIKILTWIGNYAVFQPTTLSSR